MIIIYKEISHSINQICSGHNYLVIPVSPQFPDVIAKYVVEVVQILDCEECCLRKVQDRELEDKRLAICHR